MTVTTCMAPGGPSLSGYKHHRCRCGGCRDAARDYNRRSYRLQAYGRWQPYVDAEPARRHVQHLRGTCYSVDTIAELASVGYATVNTLIWHRGGKPRKRIRKEVSDKILALQPNPDLVIDRRTIDATVTHRRIQALAAIGWSLAEQSRQIGRDRHFADAALRQQQVMAGTERLVRDLYERLWDKPRSDTAGRRARRYAADQGWAPPAAWDDISDPTDTPNTGGDSDDAVDEVLVRRALHGHATADGMNDAERVELARLWRQHRVNLGEPYGYKPFAAAFGIREFHAQPIMRAATQAATRPNPSIAAESRTNERTAA